MTNTHDEHTQQKDGMAIALERIEEARRLGITKLDLVGLGLTGLPESLWDLTQLQELYLSNNQLTAVPEEIGQLEQLGALFLYDNQLMVVPERIGQLTKLQSLTLASNKLMMLPEGIGQLEQLRDLALSDNQLTELPEWIGRLGRLRWLDLRDNKLKMLPKTIGHLAQLQMLGLSGNRLMEVPEFLAQLTQLQHLELDGNQLIDLPLSLKGLPSLTALFLHGNEQLGLPAEILGPPWELFDEGEEPVDPHLILDYYFRARSGRPLNEAKLILVGRGGVGKTSLVNQLVHRHFDRNEEKTEGIQITEWKRLLNGDEDIRLNVWDFGGQEIMHATHQFFLTQRSLYLLVLNGREGGEDADAEYWLKLIESFGGDSPVIVVLNKMRQHQFDLNYRGLQQKYPNIHEFVRTDCEDVHSIAELRKVIDRETDRLKHLRDRFPANWFEIKDYLAQMPNNYLEFESKYSTALTKEVTADTWRST